MCVCIDGMCHHVYVCDIANDGALLEQLPKVKILRNDRREGSGHNATLYVSVHAHVLVCVIVYYRAPNFVI